MNVIKRCFQKFKDRFATRLPDGMNAYENWAQSLIDTYGFPNNDSVRFMFAAMILNTKQTDAYLPKRFFALSGLAAASKEIAHGKMVELKEAQEAKVRAEAAAKFAEANKPAEVTALTVVSDAISQPKTS